MGIICLAKVSDNIYIPIIIYENNSHVCTLA